VRLLGGDWLDFLFYHRFHGLSSFRHLMLTGEERDVAASSHITLAQRIPSDTWIGIGVGAHFL
jgi:hypothetical protein